MKSAFLEVPIIFIIFNRPKITEKVFAEIAKAKPKQLLVISDGPRFPEEAENCRLARKIIDKVDWDCEVLTNFSDENMGCGNRLSSGLDWAFDNVEEAIILEDDCLPLPSFFTFCAELLEKYKDNPKIMHISGTNIQLGQIRTDCSYYFSAFPMIWGWATWRRAWKKYDYKMESLEQFKKENIMEKQFRNPKKRKRLMRAFGIEAEKINTWDIQWFYSCARNNGLCIMPRNNLVSNIGYQTESAHPSYRLKLLARLTELSKTGIDEIRHPPEITKNNEADEFCLDLFYGRKSDFINRIKSIKGKQKEDIKRIIRMQNMKKALFLAPELKSKEHGQQPWRAYQFLEYKDLLKKMFNLDIDFLYVDTKKPLTEQVAENRYDVIIFQSFGYPFQESNEFRRSRSEFLQALGKLRNKKKILYLDSHDSTFAADFDLLPYVDFYIKSQFLSELENYNNPSLTGLPHFDAFVGNDKTKIINDEGFKQPPLPLEHRNKLVLGWNLGAEGWLKKEFANQNYSSIQAPKRDIDINCRIRTAMPKKLDSEDVYNELYSCYRNFNLKKAKEALSEFNSVVSDEILPRKDYLSELARSKICFSPFGFGEVCYRDFEAVMAGCLLVKPSMDHVMTSPNIYLENETYVPIKWDLSDLKDKCRHYLNNEEERKRIAKNAAKAYADYFKKDQFLHTIRKAMSMLKIV